jgi:uncharacterized protein YqeY
MSLHNEISGKIKEAMIKRDAVRLSVLRNLLSSFMNESIAIVQKTKKPQEFLTEEEALTVVRKLVKQRKDSIDQFTKGGRTDLADSERAELIILEAFLPTQMSHNEVLKIATAKKTELGITDKAKLGQFVGMLMKDLKGKADGAVVKEVAESLFA